MDYRGLIKSLEIPDGYEAPVELTHLDIRAVALSREHVHDDTQGINASIELIRRTRGGPWPTGPVTVAYNYVDGVWHEAEFRDGHSFTYAVYDSTGHYLGCCYFSPMGRRTPLTDELFTHDVDVSWWVTPDAYDSGYYEKLYAALRSWVTDAFPFRNPYFSNLEIPDAGDAPG